MCNHGSTRQRIQYYVDVAIHSARHLIDNYSVLTWVHLMWYSITCQCCHWICWTLSKYQPWLCWTEYSILCGCCYPLQETLNIQLLIVSLGLPGVAFNNMPSCIWICWTLIRYSLCVTMAPLDGEFNIMQKPQFTLPDTQQKFTQCCPGSA